MWCLQAMEPPAPAGPQIAEGWTAQHLLPLVPAGTTKEQEDEVLVAGSPSVNSNIDFKRKHMRRLAINYGLLPMPLGPKGKPIISSAWVDDDIINGFISSIAASPTTLVMGTFHAAQLQDGNANAFNWTKPRPMAAAGRAHPGCAFRYGSIVWVVNWPVGFHWIVVEYSVTDRAFTIFDSYMGPGGRTPGFYEPVTKELGAWLRAEVQECADRMNGKFLPEGFSGLPGAFDVRVCGRLAQQTNDWDCGPAAISVTCSIVDRPVNQPAHDAVLRAGACPLDGKRRLLAYFCRLLQDNGRKPDLLPVRIMPTFSLL